MQADVLTTVVLPLALFIIMFGMGLSLRIYDFQRVFQQPKAALLGLIAQLLMLPILALVIATAAQMPAELAVGLMIISFAPGGATSNIFTNLAKGDVALSISLTAVSSLITPFTIPLFTLMAMNHFIGDATAFELPLLKTIIQLTVISIVPVILGIWVLNKWPTVAKGTEPKIRVFSVVFLFLIIAAVILKNKVQMADFFLQTGFATLSLNVAALTLGYFLPSWLNLSAAQSVSIGYEVGIQNGTLALLVAGTLIGNSTMMVPAVTYSILMFVTGFLFHRVVLKRASNS